MQHEAARPKGKSSWEDEPSSQPMRPAARGQIARNPSTDQKRVRRAQQRKVAEWTPGHVNCSSCGFTGHPVLGDGTSANCARCGSYDVTKTRPGVPTGGTPHPDNSRYLDQGDYARMASAQPVEPQACPDCWGRGQVQSGYALTDEGGSDRMRPVHTACPTCGGAGTAKVATVLTNSAEWLNPGDEIRIPNGKTQKVVRVRPHETSAHHVYVDTDGGTTVVNRTDKFNVVPRNSQQQSMPGYGIPGGNTNRLPGDPQTSGDNVAKSTQCPVCGAKDSLTRQGDGYVCQRCGYREQVGGAGGHTFSDSPSVVKTFSTINTPHQSAIARRAQSVLNQKENPL